MVTVVCLNMEGDRDKVWNEEWRCLNWGEIFDPRTLENRLLQHQAGPVWRTRKVGRCLIT